MKIIIKGDFTIEADIKALDMMCKRFSYIELETREIPSIVINQMRGIAETTGKFKTKIVRGEGSASIIRRPRRSVSTGNLKEGVK